MRTLLNNERAAMLNIRRDGDALRVLAAVETFIDEERHRLPPDMTLDINNDISALISDRLSMLLMNALQGFALIYFVLWASFSIRFSLTVAATVRLSLLASVVVLNARGTTSTSSRPSGLLIDLAIVINENIARHAERGCPSSAPCGSCRWLL